MTTQPGLFVVCLTPLLFVASSAMAVDTVVPIPSGGKACSHFFAASATGLAVVIYPQAADPYVGGSTIMVVHGGNSVAQHLPGKVFHVDYSPTGAYLLAHHEDADGPKVSLLRSPSGELVWTKADARQFQFSGSGEVVFALQRRSEWIPAGREVEIFTLAGESIRTFSLDRSYTWAVVPDTGASIIIALNRAISRFETEPSLHQTCSVLLADDEPAIVKVRALDPQRFIVTQAEGMFKVLDSECRMVYSFDPVALDIGDPQRSLTDYANYRPSSTSLSNRLLLFNGTYDAVLLDLMTGSLRSVPLDFSVPGGFNRIQMVADLTLVFYSQSEIRIRAIALLD